MKLSARATRQAARSCSRVAQVMSRSIWSYWWMSQLRFAVASADRCLDAGSTEAVRCFADLHHQRVSGLLEQRIADVGVASGLHDLPRPLQPVAQVKELLGGSPIHHSCTASRSTSSSIPGLRPP